MKLLLDLGNTRLKCALARESGLIDAVAFAHATPDFEARFAGWLDERARPTPPQAWLAAVAPDTAIERVCRVLTEFGIEAQRVLTPAEALGLRVAYAEPWTLGVDRWLGMLAARGRGDGAVLVASVGSALTVDAVDAAGRHLGGLIAPPPEAMRAALLARAPRLDVPDGEVQRFAASTADAIASGCLLSAAALIERSAAELARRVRGATRLVLSGGGAAALGAWLPPHEQVPHLVLEGLAIWAAHATPGLEREPG